MNIALNADLLSELRVISGISLVGASCSWIVPREINIHFEAFCFQMRIISPSAVETLRPSDYIPVGSGN
jgi:hypothetical protein